MSVLVALCYDHSAFRLDVLAQKVAGCVCPIIMIKPIAPVGPKTINRVWILIAPPLLYKLEEKLEIFLDTNRRRGDVLSAPPYGSDTCYTE